MSDQAAQTWAERAQAELGASRRFRELYHELQIVEAHPEVLRRVRQAERDEDRHALLCARMAIELGHDTGFADPAEHAHPTTPPWRDHLSEADRVLLDVVLMCCITESLNASLLNTIYQNAPNSEAGQLVHEILKDEVQHAQIGWAHLSAEHQRRDCSFVADYLVQMFEIAVKDELFLPAVDTADEHLYHYGVMPHHLRLSQFYETFYCVILPGLERFGVETRALVEWVESQIESGSLKSDLQRDAVNP